MRSPEEVAGEVRRVYGKPPRLGPSDRPMVRAGMIEALGWAIENYTELDLALLQQRLRELREEGK